MILKLNTNLYHNLKKRFHLLNSTPPKLNSTKIKTHPEQKPHTHTTHEYLNSFPHTCKALESLSPPTTDAPSSPLSTTAQIRINVRDYHSDQIKWQISPRYETFVGYCFGPRYGLRLISRDGEIDGRTRVEAPMSFYNMHDAVWTLGTTRSP